MIKSLIVENFRGFDHHEVPFRDLTVMVGANNAGKSTLVEALRLVALVTDRMRSGNARFVDPPNWLDHPAAFRGVAPAVRGMPADGMERTVFHRYAPPPAVLTATFSTGASVIVFVGPNAQVHGVARSADGAPATRATVGGRLGLPRLAVQPQVAPLLRTERLLQIETIRRGEGTYLASQHFRNQLWRHRDHFEEFREIAQATWQGLQITELEAEETEPERPLQLRVRDTDFVGEVSLMGHGLQMWLQLVWFLARAPRDGTVVLDEPDVYMHPDLQRRLTNLVRRQYRQLLIATHSIEIVSDVDPNCILSVDRRERGSSFVTSLPGLQEVVDGLGSMQNVQLARLMSSRSFYLVEGKDVKLLRILQATLDPSAHPIDLVPHSHLGGRGGWKSGVPERLPSANGEGKPITSFAILDSDDFPDDEIAERYEEARRWKVWLHVWSRKELENYLLVPDAISHLIASAAPCTSPGPSSEEVAGEIDRIVESMREEPILDSMANILWARDKKLGIAGANRLARQTLKRQWSTREGRWTAAPGKEVIGSLSRWAKDRFGVSFGAEALARHLRPQEIDPEVVEVIRAIAEARPFRGPGAVPEG